MAAHPFCNAFKSSHDSFSPIKFFLYYSFHGILAHTHNEVRCKLPMLTKRERLLYKSNHCTPCHACGSFTMSTQLCSFLQGSIIGCVGFHLSFENAPCSFVIMDTIHMCSFSVCLLLVFPNIISPKVFRSVQFNAFHQSDALCEFLLTCLHRHTNWSNLIITVIGLSQLDSWSLKKVWV